MLQGHRPLLLMEWASCGPSPVLKCSAGTLHGDNHHAVKPHAHPLWPYTGLVFDFARVGMLISTFHLFFTLRLPPLSLYSSFSLTQRPEPLFHFASLTSGVPCYVTRAACFHLGWPVERFPGVGLELFKCRHI